MDTIPGRTDPVYTPVNTVHEIIVHEILVHEIISGLQHTQALCRKSDI